MFLFRLETNVFTVILVLGKHVHGERTRENRYAKKKFNSLVATRAGIADSSQKQESIQRSNKMTPEVMCANKVIHEKANNFESKLPWGKI